jgi:outer membrane cobalamin receptor
MKSKFNHRLIIALPALILFLTMSNHTRAQVLIQGVLKCETESEARAFGTIALFSSGDTTLVSGTISDADGRFSLNVPSDKQNERHFLRITYVGYEAMDIELDTSDGAGIDLGFVCLDRMLLEMAEFVFVGERITAADGQTKTTYFLHKKIYDASFTGGDVLRFIPGIQVDFMQNIKMGGSHAVLILVNGRERDAAFVRQLDAGQIDKVEVIHHPGTRYESGVSGVINIILKEPETGLRAYMNAEIPTSASEVYIFPNYGIQYTRGRFNLSTSYAGEVSRMTLVESNLRNFSNGSNTTYLNSTMNLRQDHWSHRFNLGLDFIMNERSRVNIYGFINPYSRENSGTVVLNASADAFAGAFAGAYAGGSVDTSMEASEGIHWTASKQDTDKNLLGFGSVYFEHKFQPGSTFTLDAGYYNLRAENTIDYIPNNPVHSAADGSEPGHGGYSNSLKPDQQTLYMKADFSAPISGKLGLEAGTRGNLRKMQDHAPEGFSYREQVIAAYASINYASGKLNAQAGLRSEYARNEWAGSSLSESAVFLPYLTAGFKPAANQNLQITFRQSLRRPNIYELSPTPTMDDPWSVNAGNPMLDPEKRSAVTAGHSMMAGNSFIASQLFYQHFAGTINRASFVNDRGYFETQVHNLGNIAKYGLQLSGSLNFHPAIGVNPYFRVFHTEARPNQLAADLGLQPVRKVSFETGFSVIAKLNDRLTASLAGQYFSPTTDLQQVTFSNMLYFISLEKSFNNNWRMGLTSALPLQRSFTYHGTRLDGKDIYRHTEGNIMMSAVPLWIKVSYQFNSGKRVNGVKRDIENFEAKPKIGF